MNKKNKITDFFGKTKEYFSSVGSGLDHLGSKLNDAKNKSLDAVSNAMHIAISPVKRWLSPVTAFINKNKYLKIVSTHLTKFSMFYVGILVYIIFAGVTQGSILSPNVVNNILIRQIHVYFIAFSMLLVIVSGNIDLSVGSLLALLSTTSILIHNNVTNQNLFATVILIAIIGTGFGMFQGFLIGYLKIPSFIVTLGGLLTYQGISAHLLTIHVVGGSAQPIQIASTWQKHITSVVPDFNIGTVSSPFYIGSFLIFLTFGLILVLISFLNWRKKQKYNLVTTKLPIFIVSNVLKLAFILIIGGLLSAVNTGINGSLQYQIIYLLIAFILFVFITTKTVFGRNVYSVGGNRKAAELSGVKTKKVIFQVFTLQGFIVAIAAILYVANANSITGDSAKGEELNVIASVFIGGASSYGGIGTITGTFIGALILSGINTGLLLIALPINIVSIIKGIILISAVAYDVFSKRKIQPH